MAFNLYVDPEDIILAARAGKSALIKARENERGGINTIFYEDGSAFKVRVFLYARGKFTVTVYKISNIL